MDTEQFKLAFKDIKAPDKVMHAGSLHYLDPVREKYVPAMPEEEVRQKVLQYLIKVLKVPKQVIRVEYLLSKSGLDSKNRADILIGYYNPDDGATEAKSFEDADKMFYNGGLHFITYMAK